MNLKLHIVKTKRTDVICVSCGGFLADHVAVLADGSETDYGVHRSRKRDCVARLHVKRARKVVDHAAE
jgi:hypothetical protein